MADDTKLKIFSKRKMSVTEHPAEPGFFDRIREDFTMDKDELSTLDRERMWLKQRRQKMQGQG